MLPTTENIATAEDSFELAASGKDYCEESSCNKLQTAASVYSRLVERLERQSSYQDTPRHEETLKQIWLAAFTGANIYYSA